MNVNATDADAAGKNATEGSTPPEMDATAGAEKKEEEAGKTDL